MTKIVGIVNLSSNSFSDGALVKTPQEVVEKVHSLLEQGADVVDIGAQSTSYDNALIGEEEDWERFKFVLPLIAGSNISVDTMYWRTAEKAINHGVGYINDQSSARDEIMLRVIADNPGVKYICMCSLVLPANKNIRIKCLEEIFDWVEFILEKLEKYGIAKNRVIIDPGIGFTTDPNQSIALIKNARELKKFGVPVMVGHSRKSFFEQLTKLQPAERDIETLAASMYLCIQDIDYLRVHNVDFHSRALRVLDAIKKAPSHL